MSQSIGTGKTQTDCQRRHHRRRTGAVYIAIRFLFMLVGGVSPYVWFCYPLY